VASLRRGAGIVFLNGQVLGTHRCPLKFVATIRKLRQAGYIGEFVSVYAQQECVYIASDGGRVCRPLIICDKGKPRVTETHTAKVFCSPPPPPFPTTTSSSSLNGVKSSLLLYKTYPWLWQVKLKGRNDVGEILPREMVHDTGDDMVGL